MAKRMVTAAVVLIFSLWVGFGALAFALTEGAPDERFEKVSKELYPKAQQEGELIAYTVWDVEHVVLLLNSFSKQFPGIKTSYWQAGNPQIVSRVMNEFQADQGSVDILLSDDTVAILRAAGMTMPYETVQKDALIDHDPTMPVVSLSVQTLAYNTKQMKVEDLPKSWEDIANPKYKGVVAMDDPMRGSALSRQLVALRDYWADDARWTRFVRGLKALNVPVHRSTGAQFKLVVSGEYSLAEPALLADVLREKEKRAPVDYIKSISPIVSRRYAAVYAKTQHPNAAKLFAEWLISPAGQAVFDSLGREVSRKGLRTKTSVDSAWPSDIKPIVIKDKTFLENPRKWLDTYVKPIWEAK